MTKMILDDDQYKFEAIRMDNDGLSYSEIANNLGVAPKTISKFLRQKTYLEFWQKHRKPIAAGEFYDHHHNIKRAKGNKFILTSAQNNTFVHSKFLESLERYAEHINAQIIVGTFSYNLSGFQNLSKGDAEWFDNKIEKYIVDEPLELADGLVWFGELNILPTATKPLSGLNSYVKSGSGIIPHAKVQLESLPRQKFKDPRFLYTTGAVTQRNYIQKKSGQKASFHHIFGALIVEVDSKGDWFVRQLIANTDTGEFQDLDVYVNPKEVITGQTVEAINWGDIHAEKLDDVVASVSFAGSDSMIDVLKPKFQFVHDVLDFQSRNHHNINDPYFRYAAFVNKQDDVEGNIDSVISVLKSMERPFCKTVIVESNHDLALQKWLKTADYKTDPANALFFLKCQYNTYKSIKDNDTDFSIFEYVVKDKVPSLNVKFLKTDESFMICGEDGIECGSHGHNGINGSRGSAQSFTRLESRSNVGHSHSAKIIDGVYQAGVTGSLCMGYNLGPTTWSHSHIVTYPNGKRTIVTIKNGKWRV